ncbi:MAG: hydantoinase/oxoprolinase family protein [Methanocellales archaeon]|nr:hydantoinase/oxoprolinase family protein [Methanocellales archaeon]
MLIVGLDIGGAYTKIAVLRVDEGNTEILNINSDYFPFWKCKDQFSRYIRARLPEGEKLIGVTMTAELADCFSSKSEGVKYILESLDSIARTLVLDSFAKFIDVETALARPLRVAASNWTAAPLLVSKYMPDALFIDVGSTTTDIVPVLRGSISAMGKNDLERLMHGELVYTGALRTNLATIAGSVPVKGRPTSVSSEYFSIAADTHLILNHIRQEDYSCDTPDGKGKTRKDASRRMARLVCADMSMLDEGDIRCIASYIHKKQVEQIQRGLLDVIQRQNIARNTPIILAGIGARFLGKDSVEPFFNDVRYFEEFVKERTGLSAEKISMAAPAFSIALILAQEEMALARVKR